MILPDEYKVRKVTNPHPIIAEVPGSKSITNRALLIAALAQGKSVLHGVLFSDDSRHFLQALVDLGFDVEADEKARTVGITGCGGRIPARECRSCSEEQIPVCERGTVKRDEAPEQIGSSLDCQYDSSVYVGSAGTAARFLTAFLGLSEGKYRMDASEQMRARPMKELLMALETLGAEITYEGEEYHFPYVIGNSAAYGNAANNCGADYDAADKPMTDSRDNSFAASPAEITIDVDKSSQFLSALLITSVLFPNGITIHVTGSHGMAYVRMTVEMMRQFGLCINVSADERTYRIGRGASYTPQDYVIEPDLSAACYFYAAGAVLGVPAKVLNVHRDSLQGDIRFLSVLSDMGCGLREDADGITLLPPAVEAGDMQNILSSASAEDRQDVTSAKDVGYKPDNVPAIGECNTSDNTPITAAGNATMAIDGTFCRLHGGSWDLSAFSDQALTLAAIAPFADSVVEIRGIEHIRYQECNRINAILENLRSMGVSCEESDGSVRIYPGLFSGKLTKTTSAETVDTFPAEVILDRNAETDTITSKESTAHGAVIKTYDDHRVAMAFTIPGLVLEGQVIENPSCCRKTFEDFYEVLENSVY